MSDRTQVTEAGSTILLSDGRRLGFAEYGNPSGTPVFYCHGMPGSRLQRHPNEEVLLAAGVRLIVADRPGCGLSTFQPRRRLLDWPADMAQLADTLGIDRFAVVGVSGGGPHALACAYAMPSRLSGVAILSSPAPLNHRGALKDWGRYARLGLRIAALSPSLFYAVLWCFGNPARDPVAFWTTGVANLSAADHRILGQPDLLSVLIEDTREALRQGLRGYWWDLVLLAKPWGFSPSGIALPVHLWHGEADTVVPVSMGRALATSIPRCHSRFLPGEGHLLVYDHLADIFATLQEDA